MSSDYETCGDKRARRRAKREKTLGPERTIVSTVNGIDTLTCGHTYNTQSNHARGKHTAKYRRCIACLTVLNQARELSAVLKDTLERVAEAWEEHLDDTE